MELSLRLIVLLILGVSACTKAWKFVHRAYFTHLRHVPGPWYACWTSLRLKVAVLLGRRTQYIHSLHQRYGSFVRISPNEVAVADLAAFKTIHRIGSGFNKTSWYQEFVDGGSFEGIFAMTDPKKHAQRRKLFAQAFANSSILRYEAAVRSKIDMAVSKIKRDAKAGNGDILKWFTFMATDVSGELSFGKSFGMLEVEKKNKYIEDLETTMMISGLRSELRPLLALASFLHVPKVRELLNLRHRLDAYGQAAIHNHKSVVAQDRPSTSTFLFSKFLDSEKNQEISDDEIASEASNLIVAGSDTTAISLTYLVYMILKPEHHEIKQRLLDEIEPLSLHTGHQQIESLPYLRAVINESLRLYGAAPASLPRQVPTGGIHLAAYYLPADTIVSTQSYTLHRDPKIYEGPESFRPERWLNPTSEMKDAFSPFGAGTRTCLGIHLANLELQLAAFQFFKQCPSAKLAPNTTDNSMAIENYFLIAPKSHRCEIIIEEDEAETTGLIVGEEKGREEGRSKP